MSDKLRWVLPIPIFIFLAASWVFVRTENEVRVQVGRAQKQWRVKNYREAVELYESVYQDYPKSQYVDDALWEVGTIYYVNFYDVDRALISFHKLATQYPGSPLAAESYLKLAQIHEVELADLPKAIACWNQLLTLDISRETLRQVRFSIGNAHFKLNQFEKALGEFQLLMNDEQVGDVTDQARARAGTIMQIQTRYEESVEYFSEVLEETNCSDCRRTARLGLIESYEFLGELSKAIEVAQTIPTSEFPTQVKDDLLKRLGEKARYYDPGEQ
ncbi:MAG: tetratricopeptide repeat protein [Acidobacteriota bacterium]|nr:tetratricopeptide repeat protein [Acidobacteriota bacterium]